MAGLAARPGLWLSVAAAVSVPLASGICMAPKISLTSLIDLLGFKRPGGYWRLLAIFFALLNLKSLPFGWHLRLTWGLLRHVSLFRSRCPPAPPLPSLFSPIITSTRCSLLEMDYNLHKSNSTYFSDLDISRMHLVACLFKRGLHKMHFKSTPPLMPEAKAGKFGIYFGGVQMSFRREIKPGQNVEIWSRVLAWDGKWLYLVSHFVESGKAKPKGYWLQPSKKGSSSSAVLENGAANGHANGHANGGEKTKSAPKTIMATAISKYVFKQGRITIPPELALQGAELLPPKPLHATGPSPQSSGAGTPSADDTTAPAAAAATLLGTLPSGSVENTEAYNPPLNVTIENWDWEAVEQERKRGMKLAQHMAALDDAAYVWSGSEGMALGAF